MPPPETIYEVFEPTNDMRETQASQIYRPYYVLLNYLFPTEEGYTVFPQYKIPAQSMSVDFKNFYTVRHKTRYDMLFFLQVKSSEDLSHISSRQEADLQMREKYKRLFEFVQVKIGWLYGACAMGTKISIYKLDMRSWQLFPFAIPSGPELVTDTAPVDRWNIDLLTQEGQGQLRKIVQHIKEMSTQIG